MKSGTEIMRARAHCPSRRRARWLPVPLPSCTVRETVSRRHALSCPVVSRRLPCAEYCLPWALPSLLRPMLCWRCCGCGSWPTVGPSPPLSLDRVTAPLLCRFYGFP